RLSTVRSATRASGTLAGMRGFEPRHQLSKSCVLPVRRHPRIFGVSDRNRTGVLLVHSQGLSQQSSTHHTKSNQSEIRNPQLTGSGTPVGIRTRIVRSSGAGQGISLLFCQLNYGSTFHRTVKSRPSTPPVELVGLERLELSP